MKRNRLHSFLTECRGVALIEFALVAPLLILILVGAYELSAYGMMHSKVKNAASTIGLSLANEEANAADAKVEGTVQKRFQTVIDQTTALLAEYDVPKNSYKTLVGLRSSSKEFTVQSGGLKDSIAQSFQKPCSTSSSQLNSLGIIQTQVCADYRARIPSFFGNFSLELGTVCQQACTALTSDRPSNPDGGTPPPPLPPTAGEQLPCRIVTKVDCYGPCVGELCKACPTDDLYDSVGKVLVDYSTDPATCKPGIVRQGFPTAPVKRNFIAEYINVCNKDDDGYVKDVGKPLPKVPYVKQNRVCIETRVNPATGNDVCVKFKCTHQKLEFQSCLLEASSKERMPEAREYSYPDCCEKEEASGTCTEFHNTAKGPHCKLPGNLQKLKSDINQQFNRLDKTLFK